MINGISAKSPEFIAEPQTIVLTIEDRKAIAAKIKERINESSINRYQEPNERTHLGASIIGHPCQRYLYYKFRWIKRELFDGRMHRLFNRGHREESQLVEILRSCNLTVFEHDPNAEGKQFRIAGFGDHYGGSLDGLGILPTDLSGVKLLPEFKTHNQKSFDDLVKHGVKTSKPRHFAQMSEYGPVYNLKYGLYMAVNKNTDDIHIEIIELDWRLGALLATKAGNIIAARSPPERISETPTFHECKYCCFLMQCHYKELPEKNCRSCIHSVACEEASWFCEKYSATIEPSYIPQGCDAWEPIL